MNTTTELIEIMNRISVHLRTLPPHVIECHLRSLVSEGDPVVASLVDYVRAHWDDLCRHASFGGGENGPLSYAESAPGEDRVLVVAALRAVGEGGKASRHDVQGDEFFRQWARRLRNIVDMIPNTFTKDGNLRSHIKGPTRELLRELWREVDYDDEVSTAPRREPHCQAHREANPPHPQGAQQLIQEPLERHLGVSAPSSIQLDAVDDTKRPPL